jgi:hypothetical protein
MRHTLRAELLVRLYSSLFVFWSLGAARKLGLRKGHSSQLLHFLDGPTEELIVRGWPLRSPLSGIRRGGTPSTDTEDRTRNLLGQRKKLMSTRDLTTVPPANHTQVVYGAQSLLQISSPFGRVP